MSSRLLTACYGAWMACLTAAFYAFPSWHILIWSTIGLSSVAAMVTGVLRNKPRRRLPWLLLATGILMFDAGDVTYFVLTDVLGQNNPFPSAADAVYLAEFVLLGIGLLSLARSGSLHRDWASLVDTLILTTGAGLLSWVFLIDPYVRSPDLTVVEKMVSIAYPLGDVLILATIARLLVAARRSAAVTLLAFGILGGLVADVLYGLDRLGGSWQIGGPIDLGWIVFYVLWGAAALQPSMVTLTEPRFVPQSEVTGRRLVLLTLSSLIAPGVLLIEGITGKVTDGPVIALVSAAVFALVLFRLSGVVGIHRRALVREQGLRDAGAALVVATQVAEVVETVRRAVARMLPPQTPHRVVLIINPKPTAYHPAAAWTPQTPRPQADSGEWAEGRIRFRYTRTLDPAVAGKLANFDITLWCPLSTHDRFLGEPDVGSLFVAAEETTLLTLQHMVEVLAAQAALALERITLSSELSRRSSEEYFRTLVQNTADVILIVDDTNRIKYASPSAQTMFGRAALVGVALPELLRHENQPPSGPELDCARDGVGSAFSADWEVLRPDDVQVDVELSCRDLRTDPTVGGQVITLRDVTQQRLLERELTHRAYHDALTGLANRVLFQERVEHAMVRSRDTDEVVGVLFVDLDDFKVINDTLGHETGDRLLIAVSQRLTGVLRPEAAAARLGGDEFAVLIEGAADPTDLERVADRLVSTLAEPFRIGSNLVSGAVSIGVATNADASEGQDLLRLADLALYVAKGAGKRQWRRYQATLHTEFLERLELRGALDQAAADGAFALQYQPIVALTGGMTAGFEALVRWHHPTRGLLGPDQFIDVAEETGLIVPIGNWVLENAMAAAVRWQRALAAGQSAPPDTIAAMPYVSINISVRQFRTPGFVEKVSHELRLSGLPPRSLVLEITESLLLRDDEQVWSDLTGLRDIGVRIAIDDFGSGHASLSYLRHVPIDIIKIDRLFIDALATSTQQRAVVDSVVRLARTLGLEIVAEGIEQPDDRDLLVKLGCPFGQGFLFSRPLSYGDAIKWLLAEHVAAA